MAKSGSEHWIQEGDTLYRFPPKISSSIRMENIRNPDTLGKRILQ